MSFVLIAFVLYNQIENIATARSSDFLSPSLSIRAKQYVISMNETLHVACRGSSHVSWSWPNHVINGTERLSIINFNSGVSNRPFWSNLTLSKTQAKDTGYYYCNSSSSNARQRKTALYIFVKDKHSPFVEQYTDVPKVVYMTEGKTLIIPCRVTAPDLTVTLKTNSLSFTIDGKEVIWDSKQGFVISRPTYKFIGLLTCETSVNGSTFRSIYLTHRQVNSIKNVQLNVTSPVKMLSGKTLVIKCTVTAKLNSRVEIVWDFPGKENRNASITTRIDQTDPRINTFYSTFVIENVFTTDKGNYICQVKSGETMKKRKATVNVYAKPFINARCRKSCIADVLAGQGAYRFPVKVKAFPPPEILWLKNGQPIAERSTRYKITGYALTIRDISEEDAGSYSIILELKQWNLYKNITFSLNVNVKPHICEKAVSNQNFDLFSLGSKQILSCTAYGIPIPRILWGWQPCAQSSSKAQCKTQETESSTVFLDAFGSNMTGNKIHGVTERTELLDGKYKTVSALVVAEANISGIYRCLAVNKVGKDERNINFFITDIPNEFGFEVGVGHDALPTEGDDLILFCRANKFLYSNITCRLLSRDNHTVYHLSMNEINTKEYSVALNFTIKSVSLDQSGTYECAAENIITREETIQRQKIYIRAQEVPYLLRNLTSQEVNVSSSITLECHVEGRPMPQIIWYKNNRRLLVESGITLGPGSKTLIIERVKEEDEGFYQCHAANRKGFVETSAYITVRGPTENSNLELITLTCTCVAAALFWLLLTLFIRKLKKPRSAEIKTDYLSIIMDPDEVPLDEQCEHLPYDDNKWEFPRDRLKLGKTLGRGAFGKVVEASAFGIHKSSTCKTVAIKMLKEGATASEYKALMSELKILIHIGHHLNVVNLLGACTRHGGPLMVIVEYCKYGNLSNYLKSKRNNFVLHKETTLQTDPIQEKTSMEGKKKRLASVTSSESSTSSGFDEDKTLSDVEEEEEETDDLYKGPITMEDLISYSFQVARGMEFLASRKCIHRDLAARNVLLSENNVVKICDFGLARDIYKDPDYVRKGDARLPLKWMAPESIFDKIYNTQSDVWSYGVLLWEIFSLGASPYPGVQIDEDFCRRLREGTRMRAPEYSTPEIYQILLDCWYVDPKERPTFTELVQRLGDLLQANAQQDGKDYIPLSTMLVTNSFHFLVPTSPDSCLRDEMEGAKFNYERTGSFGYINTGIKKHPQNLKTFEELPLQLATLTDDYQTDSGMVLTSEELDHPMWANIKPRHLHSFGLKAASKSEESVFTETVNQTSTNNADYQLEDEGNQMSEHESLRLLNSFETKMSRCTPPPDYNSLTFYTSPHV
ncbi:vascular endothelial growth factor receptor 1 isoform X1 [Stegostoma tigrinum]|uniref:vascular endothelial growth factor receptor 1 isoform X1 n=2 Tax=Stegostoma tigrinum TaxID=3053191 RepID=UPI00202B9FA5|nr:vascular endothelial growth factor receptor 1 isoform X1 [Stegostoma tigrinum]